MSTQQTALDVLVAAKELIKDEKNWTRGEFARLPDFIPTYSKDPKATCFCSLGAVDRVSNRYHSGAFDLLFNASRELGAQDTIHLNDEFNHSTVMKMFDLAIEKAKTLGV